MFSGTGNFEITEGQSAVAQGFIKISEGQLTELTAKESDDCIKLLESDFYKEMRLRGYYHKDAFRAVVEARSDGLGGKIKWNSNWTTFIDCLLQFQVMMKDTRQLMLPTKFRKLIINPLVHEKILSETEEKIVDVFTCLHSRIIQAGGVEIHEFEGSLINRRLPPSDPVLEIYKFVSHLPATELLSNIDMGKFCVQLLLENAPTARLVSVEIDSDDSKNPLSEFIFNALSEMPMIASDVNYLTQKEVEVENVKIHKKELAEFENVNIIVKSGCANDADFLLLAKKALVESGFILSREAINEELQLSVHDDLQLVASVTMENERIAVLQFNKLEYKEPDHVIKISSNVEEWLEPLKEALKTGTVLAYSQEELSGLLGLINCVRREYSAGSTLRCVFIDDADAPEFVKSHSLYEAQLKLGLAINVLKNGKWGSYRHLKFLQVLEEKTRTSHCYANCLVKGDISSLSWFAGQFSEEQISHDPDIIKVQFCPINFRDVMQASGRISFDFLSRIQQQCILGFEFSGIMNNGRRVAALGIAGAFTTYNHAKNAILWDVPDDWSLEEACTIPLVYSTVYISFFVETDVKRGQSILIHAGICGQTLSRESFFMFFKFIRNRRGWLGSALRCVPLRT